MDGRIRRYADLACVITAHDSPVRLVGVDGGGGAGKTTFAARLGAALGTASIIHTDDFGTHEDFLGWPPTLLHDVVEPLLRGEAASYRPYDWVTRRQLDPVAVAPAPVVLIEGVGATNSLWRDRLAMRIWVDAPRDVRLARGVARDGEELRDFWLDWLAAEDAYLAAERPFAFADVLVDGMATPPAEGEYVELSRLSDPR